MISPALLRWLGDAALIVGAFGLISLVLLDPSSGPRRAWTRYLRWLRYETRFLRLSMTGPQIAYGQGALCLALVVLAVWLEEVLLVAAVALVALGPSLYLHREHARRVSRIEEQLDTWLVVLANGLRAAPSLGDAIRASTTLVPAPLSEEVDETVKEMRFGTPVDRAVKELGLRIGSRSVQGALAALLVGRQAGGELSVTLEETAASMREMTRLEAVLRTKTAEGRMQAYVLASIPFFLLVAIQWIDPHWLAPLAETGTGVLLSAVSAGLWLGAILLARRILTVDL